VPIGLYLWKWDERTGAKTLGVWPNNVELDPKTLMQLYSQHLYSAKADIVSLFAGSLNILSIWTGSINNYYLSLLLKADEEGENYSEIIAEIMFYLIPYIEDETFLPLLPTLYQRFVQYPNANEEQKLAILYSNSLNQAIIQLLREEGFYYKDEMKIWLEDNFKQEVFNYDIAIDRLSQKNFIKVASVKNIEGTYLFMINDIVILRVPPQNLIQKQIINEDIDLYNNKKEKIRNYFKFYQPQERDTKRILELFSDTNYYITLDFLRKTHSTVASLQKLQIHGVKNVFDLVNELQILDIVDTEKNIHGELIYFLKTDIIIEKLTPQFMMRRIFNLNRENKKNPLLLKEYIKILKETYLEELKSDKASNLAIKRQKRIKKEVNS
jgi:hypothetical protein